MNARGRYNKAMMNSAIETRPEATGTDATLVLTDAAARKVRQLIDEEGDPALKLRVFVNGGGCSGFRYGFSFDDEQADDDLVVERDGACLLVDPLSLEYLAGAEVDYVEELASAQFVVNKLSARATCSCGTSFTV